MKTISTLKTYPDETSVKGVDVEVSNHFTMSDRVVFKIDGKEFILIASELKTAIESAVNANRV